MNKSMQTEPDQTSNHSRFGLFGDMPTRSMIWILQKFPNMPFWVEAGLLYFFSLIILLFAREQREAIRKNLSIIWDDLGWIESYVGTLQVFANFGWTYIDGLRTRLGQDVITWEIDGMNIFEELRDTPDAAAIFTTHTGNYDLAAALFSSKFERTLHTVRAPERSEYLQKIRKQELQADIDRYKYFQVHYNSSESLLGIELAKLLTSGEIVAIQCDRVIEQVVELQVPFKEDLTHMRIPKGPMTLATFAKCPCYPLYVIRNRYRHYTVIFESPLNPNLPEGQRRLKEEDIAKAWVKRLRHFLAEYALQWFVFENAFTKEEQ